MISSSHRQFNANSNIQSERQQCVVKCESMKLSIISIAFLLLVEKAQYLCAYERYPNAHHYHHYKEYDYFDYNDYIQPNENDGNTLADYWKVFKETFQKSYKDLNKPYVIERRVPVYVPVDRVRTVVKHHPVFIKPNRNVDYRKRPNYQKY